MSEARLTAYLEGGVPPGGNAANPGARDSTPPRRSVPVDLPGALYFAGRLAPVARGRGVLRPRRRGRVPTAARAYLITAHQFADIAAQEMYRVPQEGDPLVEVVVDGIDGGRHHVGPGRYETLDRGGPARGRADAAVHRTRTGSTTSSTPSRRRRTSRCSPTACASRGSGTRTTIAAYFERVVRRSRRPT